MKTRSSDTTPSQPSTMLGMKRKPRHKPGTDARPTKRVNSDTPQTSPKNPSRHNLTLADWLTVYAYIDAHPAATQTNVVRHFHSLDTGALLFDQSTLSRKLRERSKMEARANDNPAALSSKRPRIVTRPDVERALIIWFKDMQNKGETVSGRMLKEKRKRFEDLFQVPKHEQLLGESWVQSFCQTYKIRHVCPHGEDTPLEGNRSDEAIVEIVHEEMAAAVSGKVIQVQPDSIDEDHPVDSEPPLTRATAMSACQLLERAVKEYGDAEEMVVLSRQLCRFRAKLRRDELLVAEQTTLDSFVKERM